MNTKNFDEVVASTLAGLQIDLLQKLRKGIITIAQFEKFLNLSPGKRVEFFGSEGSNPTFQKSDFFKSRREPGQIQLIPAGADFKDLLETASENLAIVSVPKFETLTKRTYYNDIIVQYGTKLTIKPIDKILSEMHAIISSKDKTFADGRSTVWCTRHNDRVFYVFCHWSSSFQAWLCDACKFDEDLSDWYPDTRLVVSFSL